MTSDATAACPGCGAGLECTTVAGARRYVCRLCESEVMGLAVLNRLSADGAAHRIWASARPPDGAVSGTLGVAGGGVPSSADVSPNRCPFCSTPMWDASSGDGVVGVCRRCQMVWLTKEAMANLPGTAAERGIAPAPIARCENCGGPLKDRPDGRCTYCGVQVVTPQVVVVIDGHDRPPGQAGTGELGWTAARTAASIAGTLVDLLFDPH